MTQLASLLPASQNNLTHLNLKTDILFPAKTQVLLIGGLSNGEDEIKEDCVIIPKQEFLTTWQYRSFNRIPLKGEH